MVERLTYAGATDTYAQHNQCGRLIRHDDPAGNRLINEYGLAGAELAESRRYPTGHVINPSDKSLGAVEADLVSIGERDSVLAKYTEEHVSKDKRIQQFGVERAGDIEAVLKNNSELRTATLMNNADSLSLLVFSLGYEAVWHKNLNGS